jgi:hypothetical protein
MNLWKTETKRTFPKGVDDPVGERLRESVVPHIWGYTDEETYPELQRYCRIIDGYTSITAEDLIDLRILLKSLHADQAKQKELKERNRALNAPESFGYDAAFLASANKVEDAFDELFEEPEIKRIVDYFEGENDE